MTTQHTTDTSKTTPRYFYAEAYATGNGDGPSFASFPLTQAFIDRLKKLQSLCIEHELSEVRVSDCPETWGPGDCENDLRLTCEELVVTCNSFWFVDVPKYGNCTIETRSVTFEYLERQMQECDGDVFSEYLDDQVVQYIAEELLEEIDEDALAEWVQVEHNLSFDEQAPKNQIALIKAYQASAIQS